MKNVFDLMNSAIENIVPLYTKEVVVALGKSKHNNYFGDISNYQDLDKLNDFQALFLSLGFGESDTFGDITKSTIDISEMRLGALMYLSDYYAENDRRGLEEELGDLTMFNFKSLNEDELLKLARVRKVLTDSPVENALRLLALPDALNLSVDTIYNIASNENLLRSIVSKIDEEEIINE